MGVMHPAAQATNSAALPTQRHGMPSCASSICEEAASLPANVDGMLSCE